MKKQTFKVKIWFGINGYKDTHYIGVYWLKKIQFRKLR